MRCRAILDEAHVIRNKRTLAAQTCTALQAERRWCLTGTPIVNSASDVFSLFCFLRFTPFSDINVFNHQIRNRVQTVRNRRAPTLHARRAGFEELRCAMLVRRRPPPGCCTLSVRPPPPCKASVCWL